MKQLKKIAYDCRKATLLIEKKQTDGITTMEKIELNIHLSGCSVCRLFQRQSIAINQMVRDVFHSSKHVVLELDNNFKMTLQTMIDEKL